MNTEKIRQLNDQLRKYGTGGRIMLTQGVQALGEEAILQVMMAMQCHEFVEGDDPYGEHDFGAIKYEGRKIFFKVDYYDQEYKFHSADAADPNVTRRVLTLMLAEEY